MRLVRSDNDDNNFGFGGVIDEQGETEISVSIYRKTGDVLALISDKTTNENKLVCEHFFCEEHKEEHWIAVGVVQFLNGAQMGDPVQFPVAVHVEGGLEQGLDEARKMANEDLLKKLEASDGEASGEDGNHHE